MAPIVSPALLRVDEVADRLAVSRATAYRLIQRGALPIIHIGASVRIPADALDRWIEDQVAAAGRVEPR